MFSTFSHSAACRSHVVAIRNLLNKDAIVSSYVFFFFFQAEDGIRDTSVTGVQTLLFRSLGGNGGNGGAAQGGGLAINIGNLTLTGSAVTGNIATAGSGGTGGRGIILADDGMGGRSEERRVGKERGGRWEGGR